MTLRWLRLLLGDELPANRCWWSHVLRQAGYAPHRRHRRHRRHLARELGRMRIDRDGRQVPHCGQVLTD